MLDRKDILKTQHMIDEQHLIPMVMVRISRCCSSIICWVLRISFLFSMGLPQIRCMAWKISSR